MNVQCPKCMGIATWYGDSSHGDLVANCMNPDCSRVAWKVVA